MARARATIQRTDNLFSGTKTSMLIDTCYPFFSLLLGFKRSNSLQFAQAPLICKLTRSICIQNTHTSSKVDYCNSALTKTLVAPLKRWYDANHAHFAHQKMHGLAYRHIYRG